MAGRKRRRPTPWDAFSGPAGFLFDCQAVIGLRMIRLATGGAPATRESVRMVTEKAEAFAAAQVDAAMAFPASGFVGAAAAVERRYRLAVAANRRRLSRSP